MELPRNSVPSTSDAVPPSERGEIADSAQFLTAVEGKLHRFLVDKWEEMGATIPECLALLEEILRVVGTGGKRLRPLLCYLGYRATGGSERAAIVRAAAAIELVHTFALIHDDLIDDARLRRGVPTSSRQMGTGDCFRFGQSSALLVGDLCHVLGDELLCNSGFPPDRILDAFHHFNKMRRDAVCGEYLDLVFSIGDRRDEAAIHRMTDLKTASYSAVGPLLVGAALGGAPGHIRLGLAEYGHRLGLAFQFSDDVVGLFGEVSVTGKDTDADPRKGKQTMLLVRGWEMGGPATRRLLQTLARKPEVTAADVQQLRMALEECGALARTLFSIRSLVRDAKQALEPLAVDTEVKEALGTVVEWIATRVDWLHRV